MVVEEDRRAEKERRMGVGVVVRVGVFPFVIGG